MAGDDTGGASEDSNAPRRRASDHQTNVNPALQRPDDDIGSWQALRNLAFCTFRAGFDPRDADDMDRLASLLRSADAAAKELAAGEQRRAGRRVVWYTAGATSLLGTLGVVAAGAVPWVVRHLPAWLYNPGGTH